LAQRTPIMAFVIADVRYANEIDYIHRHDGVVYRVTGRPTSLAGDAAQHPSEHELDDRPELFDGFIDLSEGEVHTATQVRGLLRAHRMVPVQPTFLGRA
jgi:hypothetical protein